MKKFHSTMLMFFCGWSYLQSTAVAQKELENKSGIAAIHIKSPLDYQVVQRESAKTGHIHVTASPSVGLLEDDMLEAQINNGDQQGSWQPLAHIHRDNDLDSQMDAPAGGWYQLRIRLIRGDQIIAASTVEHFGVGEVFVVAGQSNSANHGEEKQQSHSGRVTTFDGAKWQLSNDPQPGASGGGGSFMPPFGDAIADQFDVPVGFIACGIGATSVREWLPIGSHFPNPPTIESRVVKSPEGHWESKGEAFDSFVNRLKPLGNNGFRAVLWHQGESDANQRDVSRTLSGDLYSECLKQLIDRSRHEIGWEAPWFVAQVSYHVPGDEASPDIRDGQATLWKEGIALEGPDTDALNGLLRENKGQGVHFSGPGLREHGKRWVEKVEPWLEQQLKE